MLLFEITQEFDRQLKDIFESKPVIYNWLKNHERKNVVLNRVCNEVLIYEKKFHARLKLSQRNAIIKEAVKLFAGCAIEHKEQQLMTEGQKAVIQKRESEMKELEEGVVEVHDREVRT